MRILLLFNSLILLAGCTTHLEYEIGLGYKVGQDEDFKGRNPTAVFRARYEATEHWACEYEHISHLRDGPPFAPAVAEDDLNHVVCLRSFGRE